MEYQVGQAGRVVVVRLFEGEDVYDSIEQVSKQEEIRCGAVLITGGLRKADVVVGPKEEKPKIVPDFRAFHGPGEVMGVGTIYWDDEGPKLHLHVGIGRGEKMMVGCPRGGASVFLVLEVTIIEFLGISAERRLDAESGFKLLRMSPFRC